MTDEQFKKMYSETRVLFWLIFGAVVVGALLENKIVVLIGTFMLLTLSVGYIVVRNLTSSKRGIKNDK